MLLQGNCHSGGPAAKPTKKKRFGSKKVKFTSLNSTCLHNHLVFRIRKKRGKKKRRSAHGQSHSPGMVAIVWRPRLLSIIYHHPSQSDILSRVVNRVVDWLWMSLSYARQATKVETAGCARWPRLLSRFRITVTSLPNAGQLGRVRGREW